MKRIFAFPAKNSGQSPLRTPHQPDDEKTLSKNLTIGPFHETCTHRRKCPDDPVIRELFRSAKSSQARYRKNKKQLCHAFKKCGKTLAATSPILAGFRDMIAAVKKIRNPVVKILLVNDWVNTVIEFDYEEANVSRRRSMVSALKAGKGVCVEMAELKLAALEFAGFSSSDVRYVEEMIVKDGIFDSKHAVVEVRIGDDKWILNNQQGLLSAETPVTDPKIQTAIRIFNSTVKSDDTHLNLDADVMTKTSYPYKSFNSRYAAIYERNAELWGHYKMGGAFGNHDVLVDEPDTECKISLRKAEIGATHAFVTAVACVKKAIALRYGITPA